MKKLARWMAGGLMTVAVLVMSIMPVVISGVVMATCDPTAKVDENGDACTPIQTAVLPEDWGVEEILRLVLDVIVYGLGAVAVLGVVIAGIAYMTARDNATQAAAARKRLIEVAIGLVAWGVMFGVLNWLVPGGLNI